MPKPRTLTEASKALAPRKGGRPCTVCVLPPAIRSEVTAYRKDGRTCSYIAQLLRAVGYPIQDCTVQGHFRKGHE